jgi:hypothetical protein
MRHYVRFVRSLAFTSTLVACGAGNEPTSAGKQPQTEGEKAPVATDFGAAADAGADAQASADAQALTDAYASPKTSGPLAPPELPTGFAA